MEKMASDLKYPLQFKAEVDPGRSFWLRRGGGRGAEPRGAFPELDEEGRAVGKVEANEALEDLYLSEKIDANDIAVFDREGKGGFTVTSTCECSDEMCQRTCPLFENSTRDDLSSKTMSGN